MSSEKIVTVSWLDRLKQSIGGMVFGLALILAMVVILFWNEGRAVQTARSLAEGAGLVVSVASDTIDSTNEGKLVHVSGPVTTARPVSDPKFGIDAPGLSLVRKVEMYQWVEKSTTEKKVELGGSETQVTKYTYERQWSDAYHKSSDFNQPAEHVNPPQKYESEVIYVPTAMLDAWSLDNTIISRVGGRKPFPVAAEDQARVVGRLDAGVEAHVVDGSIIIGFSPSNPRVGDYRISYEYVPLGMISIVGKQDSNGIAYYPTVSGDDLLMVGSGKVSAQEMFKSAASSNSIMTWVLRIGGILFLVFGFAALLGPISVAASVLPFLGSILAFGTGMIALVAGVSIGSLTIGIAWFFYRPLVAIAIFAIAAAIVGGLIFLSKRRKVEAPATVAA